MDKKDFKFQEQNHLLPENIKSLLNDQIDNLKKSGCDIKNVILKVLPPCYSKYEIKIEWIEV